jgi:hypothetical protein
VYVYLLCPVLELDFVQYSLSSYTLKTFRTLEVFVIIT